MHILVFICSISFLFFVVLVVWSSRNQHFDHSNFSFLSAWWTTVFCSVSWLLLLSSCGSFFKCPWHMKSSILFFFFFFLSRKCECTCELEIMMERFSTREMIYVLFCFVFLKKKNFYWKYHIQDQSIFVFKKGELVSMVEQIVSWSYFSRIVVIQLFLVDSKTKDRT